MYTIWRNSIRYVSNTASYIILLLYIPIKIHARSEKTKSITIKMKFLFFNNYEYYCQVYICVILEV